MLTIDLNNKFELRLYIYDAIYSPLLMSFKEGGEVGISFLYPSNTSKI